MIFDRGKVAAAAQEIADHLKMVEHIKALQEAQKDLAQALSRLNDRVTSIEADLRALRAETTLAAVKECQSIINGVQGSLNQRIETLAVKVGVIEAGGARVKFVDGAHGSSRVDDLRTPRALEGN